MPQFIKVNKMKNILLTAMVASVLMTGVASAGEQKTNCIIANFFSANPIGFGLCFAKIGD